MSYTYSYYLHYAYLILNALVPGLSHYLPPLQMTWMPMKQAEGGAHTNLEPVCPLFLVFDAKPWTVGLFPIKTRNPTRDSTYIPKYMCYFLNNLGRLYRSVRSLKKTSVLPMRLQKISSFTLTFRDAEVVSAGIWLAIMGGYKNLHAIKKRMYFLWGCTVDWKFVDGEYTWYWYYIYIFFIWLCFFQNRFVVVHLFCLSWQLQIRTPHRRFCPGPPVMSAKKSVASRASRVSAFSAGMTKGIM